MTALTVIGIIVLLVLLIGFVRLGAVVAFGDGLRVRLRVGAVCVTVYPRKKRKKRAKPPKEEKPGSETSKEPKPKKKHPLPKPSLDELLDLADTAFGALRATVRRACKRLRIDPMELTVVFGDWDPALAAMLYGSANTLMFAIMPRAEDTFDIPDPSLHLRLDYDRQGVAAEGALGVSVRVCDLFAIALTLLVPMAKWYLRYQKAHKNDKTTTGQSAKTPEQQTA